MIPNHTLETAIRLSLQGNIHEEAPKLKRNPSLVVPKWKLSDGRDMPAIALGTYLGFDENGVVLSKNKELRNIVLKAIDVGYRHFDSAAIYKNEDELGEAIKMKIDATVVSRENLFITSKLWNTHHKREEVEPAIRDTLNKLGLKYVDLYLMHWPIGLNADYTMSDTDFMETWKGMEDVKKLGLARSIGVSNFNKEQLERVIKEGSVKPVALQIEVHPQMLQEELLNFAKTEDIVVMGSSPLGSLIMRYGTHIPGPKMDDPVLAKIAKKNKKTAAQIYLRWLIERNVVPLPKTLNSERLKENFNIFDFKLKKSHIEKISALHLTYSNHRINLPSFWQTHPNYPFEKIEEPIADPFRAIYGKQVSAAETQANAASGTQALSESGTQALSESGTQAVSESGTQTSSGTETETSSSSGSETASASSTEASSVATVSAAGTAAASASKPQASSASGIEAASASVTQASSASEIKVSAAVGTQISSSACTKASSATEIQASGKPASSVAETQTSAAVGTEASSVNGAQASSAAGTKASSASETEAPSASGSKSSSE